MRSLPSLLNGSKDAEIPKNFESSAVWRPFASASSANHLPEDACHLPAVPSPSFHLLVVNLDSQPALKSSANFVSALSPKSAGADAASVAELTSTAVRLIATMAERGARGGGRRKQNAVQN